MTLMKLIKFAAAALLALSSLSASASLISVVDSGSSAYAPDIDAYTNNNFTTPGYVTPDTYTIAGSLKANAKLAVTYYYLGQESSWNNVFSVPGDAEAPLKLSNKGTITTYVEKDALFDFLFTTYVPPTSVLPAHNLSVSNAQGATLGTNNRVYSFAVALNAMFTGQGPNAKAAHAGSYDAILFLDDTGPYVGDDDNHDDLLIGVRVTAVPEPTTLLLMSMGLLGLFGARRLKA
ncbi:PEP-CTERM sorting domain-containing protein [Cellvibrio sp. KY-YJ-3]|nr:PEP-CTERM sorting domain-containing protein [Cellvibrio sp. KY-YJ-3]